MNNKIITGVVIVLVAVGSFYAGNSYAGSKKIATRGAGGQFGQMNNVGGQNGSNNAARQRGALGGMASGEVISKDETGITVKLRDGGSRNVFLLKTTQVTKSVPGNNEDLKTGEMVTITGQANPDGSMNAEMVQIRPASTTPLK